MRHRTLARLAATFAVAALTAQVASAQTYTFSDFFSRPVLNVGSPSNINYVGPNTVSIAGSGATGSGSLVAGPTGNMLQLNSGTVPAGSSGAVYVTGQMTNTPGFNPQLNQNNATWSFNMKADTSPTGFGAGNYGIATVLAASGTDIAGSANGYAVIMRESTPPQGSGHPELVRFTGGLATGTITPIVTFGNGSNGRVLSSTNYLSFQVSYSSATNSWTLSVRDDGTTAWANPAAGTFPAGNTASATDSTFTGNALGQFGFLWNYTTGTNQTANFDNFTATFTPVPEPISVLGLSACGLGLVAGIRRRFC